MNLSAYLTIAGLFFTLLGLAFLFTDKRLVFTFCGLSLLCIILSIVVEVKDHDEFKKLCHSKNGLVIVVAEQKQCVRKDYRIQL